jgi:uncharacterized protein (DUF1697 family)
MPVDGRPLFGGCPSPRVPMAASRQIAFLRAVNVGGRTVRMEDLCVLFEGLGFRGVSTFIASGNVIFESGSRARNVLEKKIETAFLKRFEYETSVFIRSAVEVAEIVGHRPFPGRELEAAAALNVALLKEPLGPAAARRLADLRSSIDDFHTHGREVYWLCRKKQSESKFSNAVFERALGVCATFRGMKTMQRLVQRCEPHGSDE